jgi:hypothetical protein
MFACFPAESLAQWTVERDRTGTRVFAGLPGDCCFGQNGEVWAPPVLLAGLLDHPVHEARELIETLPQSRVRAPKILDRRAGRSSLTPAITERKDPRSEPAANFFKLNFALIPSQQPEGNFDSAKYTHGLAVFGTWPEAPLIERLHGFHIQTEAERSQHPNVDGMARCVNLKSHNDSSLEFRPACLR